MINWDDVDTVLLDMDGTLLDLRYDNMLWNTLLPQRFSESRSMPLDAARAFLDGIARRREAALAKMTTMAENQAAFDRDVARLKQLWSR